MNLIKHVQDLAIKTKVPAIKTGHTVRVHQRIKEGEKERVQIFEGLVIQVNSGSGADKTFTVRKIVGGIGVEKIFPLYSTNIVKIEVVKTAKVRRAKLFYMRDRSGKSARLKEKFVSDKEYEELLQDIPKQNKVKAKAEDTAPEASVKEEAAA